MDEMSVDVAIDVVIHYDVLRRGSCTAWDTNAHTVLEKAICQEVIDHRPRFVWDDYGIAAQQLCRGLKGMIHHVYIYCLLQSTVVFEQHLSRLLFVVFVVCLSATSKINYSHHQTERYNNNRSSFCPRKFMLDRRQLGKSRS